MNIDVEKSENALRLWMADVNNEKEKLQRENEQLKQKLEVINKYMDRFDTQAEYYSLECERLQSENERLRHALVLADEEVNKWHSVNVRNMNEKNEKNAWKCLRVIERALKQSVTE